MSSSNYDPATVARQYKTALAELTFNSKPIINSLTKKAHENMHAAKTIVSVVAEEIANASSKRKLTLIYLMDSILKNVRAYRQYFASDIVQIYCRSYDAVDAPTRKSLDKLLHTWKTYPSGPLFAPDILQKIDRFVGQVRQHEKTLEGTAVPMPAKPPLYPPAHTAPQPYASIPQLPTQITYIDQSALKFQIQSLLSARKQLQLLLPHDINNNSTITIVEQLLAIIESTTLDQASLSAIQAQIQPLIAQPLPQLPPPIPQQPSPQVSQSNLFSSILNAGLLQPVANQQAFGVAALGGYLQQPGYAPPPATTSMPFTAASSLPLSFGSREDNVLKVRNVELSLSTEDIMKPREGAHALLYDALDLQCKQCGFRFIRTQEGQKKMDAHLDWHFRQNRKIKENVTRAMSREWYVTADEWVQPGETEAIKGHASVFFENEPDAKAKSQEEDDDLPTEIPSVRLSGEKETPCEVCHESFEKYWDEDEEEWMLKNAVFVDGKFFHFTCYRELKRQKDVRKGGAGTGTGTGANSLAGSRAATPTLTNGGSTSGRDAGVLGKRKADSQNVNVGGSKKAAVG